VVVALPSGSGPSWVGRAHDEAASPAPRGAGGWCSGEGPEAYDSHRDDRDRTRGQPGDGCAQEAWRPSRWRACARLEPMNIVDPAINDYLLAHSEPADAVLRDLAEETHRELGGRAGMQITQDEGELLTMLVRLSGARQAVEVGTFTGYSSICIARGLPDDGRLLCCDVSEEYTSVARRYWDRAGVSDKIELRIAPAVETLSDLPDEPYLDFAFIDADKTGYAAYVEQIVPRLREGGLMVLDNMLWSGTVLDPQDDDARAVAALNDALLADERVDVVLLPVRDGVSLARKR
jgi:caffeoyl-CoA O-methyltransferase